MKKIIWVSTIPLSMKLFCDGLFSTLSKKWELTAVSSPEKELQEISKSQNIKTHGIRMKRGISPLSDFFAFFRLLVFFRKEKPDMVHSITPKAGLLSMLAARLVGTKVRIHTFTGLIFPSTRGFKGACCKLSDRLICRCATHVIAESQGVREELVTYGITRKPVTILGYGNLRGIDLEYYASTSSLKSKALKIRENLGANVGTSVIVYTGRIARDKGIDELIEAFDRITRQGMDVRLMLIGCHDSSDSISEKTADIIRNHPLIYFSDRWVDDVRPYYVASDFLVLPSYREGMPNAVIEACAMGIPAIVSDVNGSREIIETGINGIVIPPRNLDLLQEAMTKLIKDKTLRTKLSEKTRESVASRFDQSYVRGELVKFYEEVMR